MNKLYITVGGIVLFIFGVSILVLNTLLSKYEESVNRNIKYEVELKSKNEDIRELEKKYMNSIKQIALLKEQKKTLINSRPGIYSRHLERLVLATLVHLNVNPKDMDFWKNLLLITIATESDNGRLIKQIKGPAKGITQIERPTEVDTLRWLKVKKPELYQKVKDLRIPARLLMHEAEYNLAYSVAITYCVYIWRNVDPSKLEKKLTNEDLIHIYKVKYNTYRGKAKEDRVKIKALAYGAIK